MSECVAFVGGFEVLQPSYILYISNIQLYIIIFKDCVRVADAALED